MSSIPVIVGAAQFTQAAGTENPLDPLGLMVKIGGMALGDAEASSLARTVDTVLVSNILSWGYQDAPGALASALDIHPSTTHYSIMSGHTPQWFVNEAARRIARGEWQTVLIAGAEAQHSARLAYKGQITTQWPPRENPHVIGDGSASDLGTNSLENVHQLMIPANMYALFETALRASKGRGLEEHQAALGNLFARFSKVASTNPYAWYGEALSAETISTEGPSNPVAVHPYTRLMCAYMNVDMGAALVMTSEAKAGELGIDPSKWVYPMGGADLNNIYYVTQRPRLDHSPALEEAAMLALDQAGIGLSDIQAFDLYSCFPSMVELAMDSLGLDAKDPRPLTVTGGLPFFGGPMGNYSMHAIATVVEKIRAQEVSTAMVCANGGFNTRHAVGVYGRQAPTIPWENRDDTSVQEEILSHALPEPVKEAQGRLQVDGYIIRNSRNGEPEKGVVLGSLDDGRKTLARLEGGESILKNFRNHELVGRTGQVSYDSQAGVNAFVPEP